MKILWLCCVVFAGAAMFKGVAGDTKHLADMKYCIEQTNVNRNELTAMFKDPQETGTKQELKCYMECKMQRSGFLQNGDIAMETAFEHMATKNTFKNRLPELRQALGDCQGIKGADKCDKAFKIYLCIRNHHLLDDDEEV